MTKKRGRVNITRRWLINNLGLVFLILLGIELALIFAIRNYFYGSAKQYMMSKVNSVNVLLSRYAQESNKNFSSEMRGIIETFSDKDKMELMAVDSKGHVVLTSSGFSPQREMPMPDYEEAMNTEEAGYFVGHQPSGERIMAVCHPISSISSEYSAIRVVISLTQIDRQISYFITVLTVVCLGMLLMLAISGIFFIRSIVLPVSQISATAGKFAKGDFSVRIANRSDDEIGDLCEVINSMADELSKTEAMKNEFISSVSHELRTPLTAIKGWAEIMNTDENDFETNRKGLNVIISETERLSQMVEELLDFSRMQSGRFTLKMDTMDILAELGEAVLIYQERGRQAGVTIHYTEPDMLPFVLGDKNRLRQLFINIIDNAIKYSDKGGNVTVSAFERDYKIVITVTDDGCGISSEDLPKIKTKFYKANHTRRGSGIGLAVADEIAQMHHGTLDISSIEGEGTTVTVTLPVQMQPGTAENKEMTQK